MAYGDLVCNAGGSLVYAKGFLARLVYFSYTVFVHIEGPITGKHPESPAVTVDLGPGSPYRLARIEAPTSGRTARFDFGENYVLVGSRFENYSSPPEWRCTIQLRNATHHTLVQSTWRSDTRLGAYTYRSSEFLTPGVEFDNITSVSISE